MAIFKIAMLAIAAVLMGILLKKNQEQIGVLISISACILIFGCSVSELETVFDAIEKIRQMASLNSDYVVILLKMMGITYIAEFSSGLCKDAGYSAIASQIELFGKLSVLVLSMPVLLTLLETVSGLLS